MLAVNLSYIGFQFFTTTYRQTMWIISMDIPRDGKTISEDWKVDEFYYKTYEPPQEES